MSKIIFMITDIYTDLDTEMREKGVPNKKNNPSYGDIVNGSENIYDFLDNTSFFKKGVQGVHFAILVDDSQASFVLRLD